MIKRGITGLTIGAAVSLALVGCGVQADAHYKSAEDLQEALESEGFRCTEEAQFELFEGHGEELKCSSGMSLIVWEDDIPEYADETSKLQFGQALLDKGALASDTWMIIHDNRDMLDEMAETFGGETYD